MTGVCAQVGSLPAGGIDVAVESVSFVVSAVC